MNFTKVLTFCKRELVKGVKPRIYGGERSRILKNLQREKVIKSPMSKTLKKVDERNKETNQMSESENSR